MVEFKGIKGVIKMSVINDYGALIIKDVQENEKLCAICTVLNSDSELNMKHNAELIVEAFEIRQQIPFSLTELKQQRDELLSALRDTLEVLYECDPPKHLNERYSQCYATYYELVKERKGLLQNKLDTDLKK